MALKLVSMALVVAVAALGYGQAAHADEEEPEFDVIHSGEGFEVRQYKPYIVAETTTIGTERRASGAGFRILAGYIFGNNSAAKRMAMTAPVTVTRGVKMNMTAPVTMKKGAGNSYTMRFVMERKYTMASLPKPVDARVQIIQIPARTIAVLRYSGRTTEKLYREKRALLMKRLAKAGIKITGEPVKAVFDGPWTLSWLRRNEVQVPVRWGT